MKNFSLSACSLSLRPPDWFKPFEHAPRKHPTRQRAMLEASVLRTRHINPLLAKPDGTIIAGELRLQVAKELGLSEIPVIILAHLSEADAMALRIADNAIPEHAEWSIELLSKNLEMISTIDMTIQPIELGFETAEYDQYRLGGGQTKAVDPVPLPAEGIPTVSRIGDLFHIADQTVICGDSRDFAVYEKALAGRTAHAVISDQPWNLDMNFISGKGRKKFDNFAMASGELTSQEFEGFTEEVLDCQARSCAPGALVAQFIDWRSVDLMIRAGRRTVGDLINICVWVKQNGRFGSPWRSRHEMVCVFRREGAKSRDNVKLGKYGRNRSNVWEYDAPTIFGTQREKLKLHPTCKNESMIADYILDCTDPGDVVLDAFLGSGTTALAAHQTGRACVGIEIDPRYVDLAVQRLVELTGEVARLADGTSFDELRARRLAEER
jgi:DNA modification methylase